MAKLNALRRQICLILLIIIITANASYAQQSDTVVLTLDEAAILLRAKPEDVEDLAKKNLIPCRFIGREWRFSKQALLKWLAGQEKAFEEVLAVAEMSNVAGRGEGSTADTNNPQTSTDKKSETIGDKPDIKKAEEVFLRSEGVLLKGEEFSVELGLSYSNNEQQALNIYSRKVEAFTSSMGLRYGLMDNLQLSLSIPYTYTTDTTTIGDMQTKDEESDWGDISVGLSRSIIKEGIGYPEVILNIDGQIPADEGFYGVGISTAFIKSLDPVVLFANLGYKYTFIRNDETDASLLVPENIFTAALGYAYALNDSLSLGMSASGIFYGRTSYDDVVLQSNKQFSLAFNMTSLIYKNLYLEPSVSFGLNEAAADVTFGVALVYTSKPSKE